MNSNLVTRARLISRLRQILLSHDFFEVVTPQLQNSAAMEPFLDPLTVVGSDGPKGLLATSPEFALKKLWPTLREDFKGIFEFSHCFRDDPETGVHLPEFIMLEWYMHGTLDDMRSFSIDLLSSLEIDIKTYTFDNFDLSFEWKRLYKQPFECSLEDLETLAKELKINFLKKNHSELELRDLLFSSILEHHLLPSLIQSSKAFTLKNWPSWLRGMSKLNSSGTASRFEMYINGLEVCNAYEEESNPEVMLEVWQDNNKIRKARNKPEHKIDKELLSALPSLEGATGNALGIDRLMMTVNLTEVERNRL